MSNHLDPAYLLYEARTRAGLTQRELARRAETSQSVIARIEGDKTSPTVATLNHLLASAGFELRSELVIHPPDKSHMLEDVSRILRMTPEQRLQEVYNINRFGTAIRRV